MFGIFKKKTRKAITEVKKMENRDAVEATVWGAYSIAFADDTCDAKEIAVLEKTIAALPAFAPFSGEIAQMSAQISAPVMKRHLVVRMLRLCVNWLMWQEPPKRLMCCACVSILLTRTALVRMKKRSSRKLLRRCSCRWSSTCEKCAPCAGCHPAVSGSGGGFHRTADVGAGRWCAGGDGAGRTLAFTA
ncbi:tellurite resistance protein TciA [Escherichia coli]|nr:tellurite resistance protein TciA [Escherichia coli]